MAVALFVAGYSRDDVVAWSNGQQIAGRRFSDHWRRLGLLSPSSVDCVTP